MATPIPAGLSPREGRRFAFTLAGAFATLALLLWWRGRHAAPWFGGVAAGMALLGLLVPANLGPLQRAWMGLAHAISKVTTPVFMGVVYFVVLSPIGLVMRAFGRKPMAATAREGSFWVARSSSEQTSMERQF